MWSGPSGEDSRAALAGAAFSLGQKERTPAIVPCASTLFEPGSPGGDPANALGFPSTTAERHAHSVLGGVPVLRV